MQYLWVLALVVPGLCLPPFPPKKFPLPHAKGFFPHGKFPFPHLGFPHFGGFPGVPPFGSTLGGVLSNDGSCSFYANADFIAQIEEQLEEGEGGCDIAGCQIPSHASFSLSACASLVLVSAHNPKGIIREIPVAQPEGNSDIQFSCHHGLLSAEGFSDLEGKEESGVLVIDQTECYPCRFQSSAHEVVSAIQASGQGSCDDKGLCDLALDANIQVNSYPGAGYDIVKYRDLSENLWVALGEGDYSFQVYCETPDPFESFVSISGLGPEKIGYVRILAPNNPHPLPKLPFPHKPFPLIH